LAKVRGFYDSVAIQAVDAPIVPNEIIDMFQISVLMELPRLAVIIRGITSGWVCSRIRSKEKKMILVLEQSV